MLPVDTRTTDTAGTLRFRRSAKWSTYPADVLPAHVAEMDFSIADPIKSALAAAVERDDMGYSGGNGARFRESFAAFSARRLSWGVDPERVVLIPDVMTGVRELFRVLTEPGDEIIVTPPVYSPFFSSVREVGCTVVEAPMLAGGTLDLDRIGAAFGAGARVLLLSNPHNPLGQPLSAEEAQAIAVLADRHGAWVVSDEIWAPLVLPGGRFVPYLAVSDLAASRGFALHSASKAFNIAGLKSAAIVTADGGTRPVIAQLPAGMEHRAGLYGVLASEVAYTEGDSWLEATLAELAARREELLRLLADRLPEIRWTPPTATYLAWLDCSALGLGDDPAARFLEKGRVGLNSGPAFGMNGDGFARLNFATTGPLLEQIVDRMATATETG